MAVVVTEPRTVLIDSSGTPYPRAKRYLYAAGTSTPLTVYSDPALTTAHAVPQEADSQGFFAPAYLPGSVTSYRRVIQTSAGVQISPNGDVDNIPTGAVPAAITQLAQMGQSDPDLAEAAQAYQAALGQQQP